MQAATLRARCARHHGSHTSLISAWQTCTSLPRLSQLRCAWAGCRCNTAQVSSLRKSLSLPRWARAACTVPRSVLSASHYHRLADRACAEACKQGTGQHGAGEHGDVQWCSIARDQEARLTGTWQGRGDVDAAGPVMPELMTVEQFQEALVLGFHGASSNTLARLAFTVYITLAFCKVPCKLWVSSLLHACQAPDMLQYAR